MRPAEPLFQSQTSLTAEVDLLRSAAPVRPYLLSLGSAAVHDQASNERIHGVDDGLEVGRRRPRSGRGVPMLALADRSVSSKHARISRVADGFEVLDLESRNGTFVDGRAITRQPLRDGSILFFGGHAAVFRLLSEDSLAAISADLTSPFGPVPTASATMAIAIHKLRRLAPSTEPVFLTGETGTGKEVYARAVHRASGRRGRFVALNCAAIPAELVESELFGYARGAHSQASQGKRGLIEQAEGGTLFLDELGDMPRPAQAKLLRFLQEREVLALGSTELRRVDARVVAATAAIDADDGRPAIRKDLMMRLGTEPVVLPPLRERPEDIGELTHHFLGPEPVHFETPAFLALCLHDWPGNVRELEKVIREARLLREGPGPIGLDQLPTALTARFRRPTKMQASPRRSPRAAPGKDELRRLLEDHDGRVADVARLLDRQWSVVWRWIKRHDLDPDTFRKPR
jgi:DNA-binding NtrC family response regulator